MLACPSQSRARDIQKLMLKSSIEKMVHLILEGKLQYTDKLDRPTRTTERRNKLKTIYKPESHRYLEIATLIDGHASMQINESITDLLPDTALAILADTVHAEGYVESGQPYAILWSVVMTCGVHFFISEHEKGRKQQIPSRLFIEFDQAGELWKYARDRNISHDFRTQAKFLSLFLETCIKAIDSIDEQPPELSDQQEKIVNQVKTYIDHHYREDVTITELAKFSGYTPNYLGALFQKFLGKSIHQYLLDVRFDYAKNLLVEDKLQIKNIAFQVGFNDSLYFSRLFRKKFGVSPTKFKRL